MDTEITPKFIYLTLMYKAYVNMKVMVIHDTSSYDNTGTYQISCTANVVQQLNNSKLKVSLSSITGIGGNVCILFPHTSLTATGKI
jgi:hypothetical protein